MPDQLSVLDPREVHVTPSGLVMIRSVPKPATATKRPFPYVTEVQVLAGTLRAVQVMPSVLVITRFVPLTLTATKVPFPNVTLLQKLASVALRAVHVVPSARTCCDMIATEQIDARASPRFFKIFDVFMLK